MLRCPKCFENLLLINNSYKCKNMHSFDVSKSGYVNLLLNHPHAGDNLEMIQSRKNFLEKDYYINIAKEITNYLRLKSVILDCGCGSGYYLNKIEEFLPNKTLIGIDISKVAIEKAQKQNKNISYIVSSITNIPFEDNSVDAIINVFAPYSNSEFFRVLKNDGLLILVCASKNHLYELKEVLYESPYFNEEKDFALDSFSLFKEKEISYSIDLVQEDILNLLKMTPYFYKTSLKDKEKLKNIVALNTTVNCKILVYKKKKDNF